MRFRIQAKVAVLVSSEIGADSWEEALARGKEMAPTDFITIQGEYIDADPVVLEGVFASD